MAGWIFLVIAIVLEVLGTFAAKQASGFTNIAASAFMILCYVLSFTFLTIAMKNMEVTIAYPVWTGTSILIVSLVGVALLNESMSSAKGLSLFFLVLGLIGLTAGGQSHG